MTDGVDTLVQPVKPAVALAPSDCPMVQAARPKLVEVKDAFEVRCDAGDRYVYARAGTSLPYGRDPAFGAGGWAAAGHGATMTRGG